MKPRHLLYAGAGALALALASVLYTREDISHAFCAELQAPESYRNGLEQYQTLIQGEGNWIFRTGKDFRKDFFVNKRTLDYLLRVQKAFKDKGIDLVIVFPPVRGLTQAENLTARNKKEWRLENMSSAWKNYEKMISDLQAAGLHIVGLTQSESPDFFYYKRDHHWTARGAKAVADKTSAYIKSLSSSSSIPSVDFITEKAGIFTVNSSFEKAFAKICGTSLPQEKIARYVTTPKSAATGEGEMFGNNSPRIVLLGTSNSVHDSSAANFEGFLKENLSADIYNLAYTGAGIDTSILSFLNSGLFDSGDIKIAIWEVPGYYDFNDMDEGLFQQVIPAVYGACNDNALSQTSGDAVAGKRSTVFAKDELSLPDQDGHYISLSFSQHLAHPVILRFYNGETKKIVFESAGSPARASAFYTLFPVLPSKEKFAKITLETGQAASFIAQICKLP